MWGRGLRISALGRGVSGPNGSFNYSDLSTASYRSCSADSRKAKPLNLNP